MAAGIIEHRSGTTWIAGRGQGSFLSAPGLAPRRVSASKRQALDRRSLIVVDQYSAKERAAELNGLAALAWLKDFGSSALHLAGVASGLFDGFVNLRHKAHELGAGYLLIAESGGRLVDLDGESLDERPYDFDDTIAVVAAGSRELAEAILECLRRAAF
jgi:myo-inositol-1(or 4)-monophosphatase